MKKIICAFIGVIFLCGCSGAKHPTPVNRNISYKAHIFYYGEEYDCLIKVDSNGESSFTLTGGRLDGYNVKFGQDGIILYYMGKEKDVTNNYKKDNMLSVLYEFNESLCAPVKTTKKDGQFCIKGETVSGEYEYFVSGAGLPLSLSLDNDDFYVEFYDVSLIK
ncbi:MAG: hypothetical protein U0M42_08835 [Acutalibacteraceae bacterium]|nr:hypothetical protein [Acutalibacteraceae bacterium]